MIFGDKKISLHIENINTNQNNMKVPDIKLTGAVLIIVIALVLIPYCDRFSNMDYFVINSEETACETIVSNEKSIVVEFQCVGNNFPDLLNSFISNHKNFELESVETKFGFKRIKQFIAIFKRK